MNCKDSQRLIPSYVDDELSEPQAAPLRQHLMDCRICRRSLLGEKAFKRWFDVEVEPEMSVPTGFAERVARRAFAGDEGSDAHSNERVTREASEATETPIYQFVLRATAMAAGLLLVVSLGIFSTRLPDGNGVKAVRALDMPELLENMESLNDPAATPGLNSSNPGGSALQDMAEEVGSPDPKSEEPQAPDSDQ